MKNKIILITGGTSGVGEATVKQLATTGATIVLLARDEEKASETIKNIKVSRPGATLECLKGDLSSLKSIKEAAEIFIKKYPRLDVLINNAGGVFSDLKKTGDGYEWAFQVNYLGHFLLTNLLIEKLSLSDEPRIINLSSEAHKMGKIDFNNLNADQNFGTWTQYGSTKLMNILFTKEFKRRFPQILSFSVHPGVVRTGFGSNNTGLLKFFSSLPFLLSAEKGAETTIYLATSPVNELKNGEYYKKSKVSTSSQASYDKDTAKKLWEISMEILTNKGLYIH